ncbi:uncharacterized protein TRIADDRAFT_49818 [Trichoplax adhaerens]|uniref:Diphthine--ammonia ligase n=1 Tax=Trichoplax adhaerens TaxID=10228 RepID=B3RJT5_TRIAD|nr:hypothetical protein TRIADDRAFT_49818 [Trichoplax adhaerens]EDV29840.1 hypothetical protein TRIADDRAFT_49818 [Trichoplax adhaerens]|eukprot:XP_002109042.1 hypothetical protein TRIADDRAFT_49818 [Trichoplax adhaerens]
MKTVALISGGKDSCYNMLECVRHGHQIVALANLYPDGSQDELDSYMFQTVGHQAIHLYADAMNLPLYRHPLKGSSIATDRYYSPTAKDEVEDLYELLKEVQNDIEIEAVSVGAILSNYQRVRVENVCSRLGLVSLAYLWQRDQQDLLMEMIDDGIDARIIKVAALGLEPQKHLGKSLQEIAPVMRRFNQKYGLNICGEGGEYETFTLDCPLFTQKIIIDRQEILIHSDDAFAPVGYLRFQEMHLQAKDVRLF